MILVKHAHRLLKPVLETTSHSSQIADE